ncbi:hypothetical protein SB85_14620 [Xanthomonas sacchari]|nr:hypothetical protein SB85_14620 [Xanthomonas sacchari]
MSWACQPCTSSTVSNTHIQIEKRVRNASSDSFAALKQRRSVSIAKVVSRVRAGIALPTVAASQFAGYTASTSSKTCFNTALTRSINAGLDSVSRRCNEKCDLLLDRQIS